MVLIPVLALALAASTVHRSIKMEHARLKLQAGRTQVAYDQCRLRTPECRTEEFSSMDAGAQLAAFENLPVIQWLVGKE